MATMRPHTETHFHLRLRHLYIWFNFESIFSVRRIAKNCLSRLSFDLLLLLGGWVHSFHSISQFTCESSGTRVFHLVPHTFVHGIGSVPRAIERAIIIYSTNWIVKFKFIRNSSFPRGFLSRKRTVNELAPLAGRAHQGPRSVSMCVSVANMLCTLDFLNFFCSCMWPNWTQVAWKGLTTIDEVACGSEKSRDKITNGKQDAASRKVEL